MIVNPPAAGSIYNGNRQSNGTILTIPAGSIFTCDIAISGSVDALASGRATVTMSTAGVSEPPNGSVLADLSLQGLAATSVADHTYIEAVFYTPPANSVDLVFALGGLSSASVTINGFTF